MSKSNNVGKMLSDPTKGVKQTRGTSGVLSRAFRQMLADLSISVPQWSQYMHEFIMDPRNGIPRNRREQTSHRGNLTKEFTRPHMTWKVFTKAMRFLQVVDLEITFKIRRRNLKVTSHTVNVVFENVDNNSVENGQMEMDLNQTPLAEPATVDLHPSQWQNIPGYPPGMASAGIRGISVAKPKRGPTPDDEANEQE